jgi:chitinase
MPVKKLLIVILLFFAIAAHSQYKIIAYTTSSDSLIRLYPVPSLTHIIYSFLKVQNDTLTFHNERQKQILQQIVSMKKKYPGLKVMVSIGGWSGCSFCSALFSSEEHRRTFARTAVELFKQYDVDGLDLDWEYPAIEGFPGHAYKKEDRENFTELIRSLRTEMGGNYILSFAAGGFTHYLENSIDWKEVMPMVDMVNLMTYDLVGGYSTVTGHHTPLGHSGENEQSVKRCVEWLLKNNVPSDKLIIGAAFYARVWQYVSDTNHGLYQNGKFKQGVPYKNFKTYFADSLGYKYYWDKKAEAPFQYSASKKLFATFDDERSVKAKTKYIRRNKLGGIMFWELGMDKQEGGLVGLMHKKLRK